ncbi:unnamed protein product [Adineta steineri]|uniref:Uncharacterized protein n=1 Tax=Adineta steineri TaxID=433720 RepID=A0A818TKW0_9BILA|nr:unnamed protein product [Adineta steineri]CAF3681053.1 unnamed protein product [Adineta steineri]
MFSLKNYLRNLNVFPPSSNSEELEDDTQHQSNIVATRIFILTLILSLFGISIALLLMYQTTMITINHPTREQFELLPKNAKCSCSRISFSYGKFTSLQTNFHQVCSSDFVTDRWLKAINSGVDSTYFNLMDFRTYGSAQFHALAAFCRLSKINVDQSITYFYQSTLLSPQVLSENVFQSQIRESINQFQITAPNTFKSQLRLINEMTIHNLLMSELPTNFYYYQYYGYSDDIGYWLTSLLYEHGDGSQCDCRTDFCGNFASFIVDVFGAASPVVSGNIRWSILGRVCLHQFTVFIRKIIIELNIFEHYSSTDRQIRFQRYGTRLYIFLLFSSLTVLINYTFLKSSIQSRTISHPTQSQFIQLQQDYSQTLACPCTDISMNYSTFITIQPHYHQLCSSDLISDKWIEYIVGSISDDIAYYPNDYRVTGYSQFQLLTMFCQQAQQAIDDALRVLLQTTFISSQVLTQQSFQVQINSVIETWKLTTVNTFIRTIELFRATMQGNQLTSGIANDKLTTNSISGKSTWYASIYSNCLCALSASCHQIIDIYEYDSSSITPTLLYSIPTFFIGCNPTEALFLSSLECFYNLSCMLEVDHYINSSESFNFSALNPDLNPSNETMENIVNRLMVDTWSSNVSFPLYYNQCAPLSCTVQYEDRDNLFLIITSIVGIFGGLSLGSKLLITIILQSIDKILINGVAHFNLLQSIKSIFSCTTEHQLIHRLHFILVVVTLAIIYIFSAFSSRSITIEIEKPSLSTFTDLETRFGDSLQCSCSQISIKYELFLNVTSRFHSICSSDFVSNRWIKYLYGGIPPIDLYSPNDFMYSAEAQFQILASFCQLSQKIVADSLIQLGVSDFIDTQLLSSSSLNDRIQATINEFQLTMPQLFVRSLSLIRETIGANMLMSILSTNWIFAISRNTTGSGMMHNIPLKFEGCSCALSSKCVSSSRGMLSGCYPLESILQSTLTCLNNQACIDPTKTFKALNSSSSISSRFPLNTTIESIVNELMVEELLSNTSYEAYYKQCAPLSCTYSYVDNRNVIDGITILISLYGGLVIIYRILAILIVKQYLCMTKRVTPTETD